MTSNYKAASERSDEAERGLTSAVPHTPRTHVTYIRRDGSRAYAGVLTGGHPLSSDKLGALTARLERIRDDDYYVIHHDDLIERPQPDPFIEKALREYDEGKALDSLDTP